MILAIFQFFAVSQSLSVTVLDVGQGDSILIQTPEYHNVLIDAGEGSKVVDELGKQLSFFDKTIDLFILTHPHRDHYGGLLDVMQKYDVEGVVITGVPSKDPVYLELVRQVKERNIPIVFPNSDQDIQIGQNLFLDILYPLVDHSLIGQEVRNKNNTSVVTQLVRRQSDGWESLVMLTGDAEIGEEREILLSGQSVGAEILKVGHHGSRTATSDAFLSAVNPKTAVISLGEDNSYEHPHPETLEKLRGLEVRQTMVEGSIVWLWR